MTLKSSRILIPPAFVRKYLLYENICAHRHWHQQSEAYRENTSVKSRGWGVRCRPSCQIRAGGVSQPLGGKKCRKVASCETETHSFQSQTAHLIVGVVGTLRAEVWGRWERLMQSSDNCHRYCCFFIRLGREDGIARNNTRWPMSDECPRSL